MSRKSARVEAKKKSVFSRSLYKYSRFLHVYVSSALFSLLILFCITGIVLNHLDWLDGTSADGYEEYPAPDFLKVGPQYSFTSIEAVFLKPPLTQLQQYLAREFNLKKVSDVSLDEDAGEIILDYKLPAGFAAAIWEVGQPYLMLEYRSGGVWEVLGDLHKGRHTGPVWAWVIDISAAVMVFFAITGMIILWQNKKYRIAGSWLFVLGTITPVIIYMLWVPRLSGV